MKIDVPKGIFILYIKYIKKGGGGEGGGLKLSRDISNCHRICGCHRKYIVYFVTEKQRHHRKLELMTE